MLHKGTPGAHEVGRGLVISLDEARQRVSIQLEKGKDLLKTKIASDDELGQAEAKHEAWRDYTSEVLKQIFSTDELVTEFFRSSTVYLGHFGFQGKLNDFRRDLDNDLDRLSSIYDRLELYPVAVSVQSQPPIDPVDKVKLVNRRFHRVARQLRQRHAGRLPFDIDDEYDVQDLLHALLKIFFDDIRPEEWTPSYAGGAARMDFLLKAEQIVVEVKKTRHALGQKEVGDQLLVDIGRYHSHTDCRTLVCFVYDPEGRITNPAGLERDLSGTRNGVAVQVIVAPKGQ